MGIRLLKTYSLGNFAVLHGQYHFDQADNTGSRQQMTNGGFNRTNGTESLFISKATESLCHPLYLYRITQESACTVGFNVGDSTGIYATTVVSLADGFCLTFGIGSGYPLRMTIIIHCGTFNYSMNQIPVSQSLF